MEKALTSTDADGNLILEIKESGLFELAAREMPASRYRRTNDILTMRFGDDSGTIVLEPRGIVTTEWLGPRSIIRVVPKFGIGSCLQLLLFSEHEAETVGLDELKFEAEEAGLLSTVTRRFIESLEPIRRFGALWMDERYEFVSDSMEGNVDWIKSVVTSSASSQVALEQVGHHPSWLAPPNIQIACALSVLADQPRGTFPLDLRSRILSAATEWGSMVPNPSTSVESILQNCESFGLPHGREYYHPAILISRLILTNAVPSLMLGKEIEHVPIRYPLPRLFEKACRRAAQLALGPRHLVVDARDHFARTRGNQLFSGDSPLEIRLFPDIVVLSSGTLDVKGVADVKYLETPGAADYYQILAYMEAFDLEIGAIIYPGPRNYIRPLPTRKGRLVNLVTLDLSDVGAALEFIRQRAKKEIFCFL